MKKLKKFITVIGMIVLTAGLTLTGCGEEKKPSKEKEEVKTLTTPEVTAEAYFKFSLYGDKSKFQELGLPTTEFDTISKDTFSKIRNDIKNVFAEYAIVLTDEELEKILSAEINSLKKITPNLEVSQGKETVDIKITTSYIDVPSAFTQAKEDALKKISTLKFKSETQYKAKFKELFLNNLANSINNAKPSTDTKKQTFTFNKKTFEEGGKSSTIWAPENFTRFQKDINALAINKTS